MCVCACVRVRERASPKGRKREKRDSRVHRATMIGRVVSSNRDDSRSSSREISVTLFAQRVSSWRTFVFTSTNSRCFPIDDSFLLPTPRLFSRPFTTPPRNATLGFFFNSLKGILLDYRLTARRYRYIVDGSCGCFLLSFRFINIALRYTRFLNTLKYICMRREVFL